MRIATVTASFEWVTGTGPPVIPTLTANYTPTRLPSIDTAFTPSPTPGAAVSGCKSYYQAKSGETCRNIAADSGGLLSQEDFLKLNPFLNGNCDGLWAGYWYCVVGPNGITGMPPTATSPPASRPAGQIQSCTRWYLRDGESCADLVGMFGVFSLDQFLGWNPSVGSSCANILDDEWYCVAVPGTPTTRTAPLPTFTPPPVPTQSGMAAGCSRRWIVGSKDTCDSIARANGLSLATFLSWNPAVGSTTCDSLKPDYYVCVEVGGSTDPGPAPTSSGPVGPSSSSSRAATTQSTSASSRAITTASPTSSPPPSTTTGGISTPTPVLVSLLIAGISSSLRKADKGSILSIQDGMIAGCRRFYKVQTGDGCWAIANSAGIDIK